MSAIEEIKERVGIVDVISPFVALKKAGRSFKGLCPFHNEKTPSFLVFPDKGNYHCFGCGANGDIFTFLMNVQKIDFAEALRLLAERAGVVLPARRSGGEAEDRDKARLYEINATAAQYFNHILLRSEIGREGREYLIRRGIDATSIEAFQLGFAPDSWDALSRHLKERVFSAAELVGAGLIVERDDGRTYDRFRGRVIFPIRDVRGRVTGFGGRSLGSEEPKYLNTSQTAIFDKGGSLFGIDLARGPIRDADRAVVVEGYVDALISHQSSVRNVVACLGTALTDRQVTILKRLTKHLVLALDPDAAGDEATMRGLEVAKQVFDKQTVPVPTWRGFMRYEQKLDADIRIVALPRGKDPDEVIREDSAAWRSLLDNAQPIVDYYFAAVLDKADLSSAKGKEAVVDRLLPVLRDLGAGVQQDHYIQRLAQSLRVSERSLAMRLSQARERPASIPGIARPATAKARRPSLDGYVITLFLRYPEARQRLWELEPDELADGVNRQLLSALQQNQVTEAEQLDDILGSLDPALSETAAALLAATEQEPALEGANVEQEIVDSLAEVRRRNLRTGIDALSQLLREAEEVGDASACRRYIVKHEELLAELARYEHNKSMARLWRW